MSTKWWLYPRTWTRLCQPHLMKYKAGRCCGVVGSGREENRNSRYPGSCGLAQPSGLCVGNGSLYIADSESSTVRQVCLASGAVTSLAGGNIDPTDLFGFGDVDGVGRESKLQHPLGVASSPIHNDTVFIADSYNHKIKSINTKTKLCSQLPGLEHLKLNEPGGIFSFGENLYIADTNTHSIKLVHLPSTTVSMYKLKYGVKEKGLMKTGEECGEMEVDVREGDGGLNLIVDLKLPEGTKPSPRAPSVWTITLPGGEVLKKKDDFKLNESWELSALGEGGVVEVCCRIYICTATACVCKELRWTLRMSPSPSAPQNQTVTFDYTVTL